MNDDEIEIFDNNLESEIDFVKLDHGLDIDKVRAFVTTNFSLQTVFDGTPKIEHLNNVVSIYTELFKQILPTYLGYITRYNEKFCESCGLLHLSMNDFGFERIVFVADVNVARTISSVSPDLREPFPKRVELYVNRVGLSDINSQLLSLCSIMVESKIVERWLCKPDLLPNECVMISDWVLMNRAVLKVLTKLNRFKVTKQNLKHTMNEVISIDTKICKMVRR